VRCDVQRDPPDVDARLGPAGDAGDAGVGRRQDREVPELRAGEGRLTKLTPGIGPGGETEGGDYEGSSEDGGDGDHGEPFADRRGPSRFVQLTPVCDEQNKSWAKYTPCGKVELSLDEPAMPAFEAFQKGTFFFVDFTPAPAAEKDEAHPIG
jgi:hypothetical protein